MNLFKREATNPQPAPELDPSPWSYPEGICVKTERGTFYIKAGKRLRIPSKEVLQSWNFSFVVEALESSLIKYHILGKLGFRDGTLICNLFDAKLYLVSGNKRRPVKSTDSVSRLGIDPSIYLLVSDNDMFQDLGEDL